MKFTVRKKIKNFLLGTTLFVAIIAIWHLAITFGVVSRWLLPSPATTFQTLGRLIVNGEFNHLVLTSFMNVFPAFFMSVAAALVLGVLIGANKTCRKIFSPLLSAIYLIPSLAWLPLIILFLGFSRPTIWAVVFISSFIRIIYNIIGGVRGVHTTWLLTAKNLEMDHFSIVFKVLLPGALPQILSGIRIGFGSAWRSLIGAEMLVVTAGGLGKYIWMSQWAFKFDQVFAGIILIALIGLLTEQFIFKTIEKLTLVKWGMIR